MCGHFALETLSKTYLKDAVFEIKVFRKKNAKMTNSNNVKCYTKKVPEQHFILSLLTRVDTFFFLIFMTIHINLHIIICNYKKNAKRGFRYLSANAPAPMVLRYPLLWENSSGGGPLQHPSYHAS